MSSTPTNLRIGDCEVYFDKLDGAGERHLGYTLGGAEFKGDKELEELLTDQHGVAPLDAVLKGNKLEISVMLAEVTNQNIGLANQEGIYAATLNDSKVGFGRDAGFSMASVAGQLRLHPRKNTPSNRNEDVYIFKAYSKESTELSFKTDEQRVLKIVFGALVDTTQPDGQRLGRIGDQDIS